MINAKINDSRIIIFFSAKLLGEFQGFFYPLGQAIAPISHRTEQTLAIVDALEFFLKSAEAHFQATVAVCIFIDADNKFLFAANTLISFGQSLDQQRLYSSKLYAGVVIAQAMCH